LSTSTPTKDGVIIMELPTLLERSCNTLSYVHINLALRRSNQLKATSIAFCGSSEIIAPTLSCSVLIFLLKLGLEPLLFLPALQDHVIISKNMQRDIYRLPVV
jgi:hypothetical protein